ncbi:MAG: hypothetical protein ABF976_08375 [Acetobacter syzygii]
MLLPLAIHGQPCPVQASRSPPDATGTLLAPWRKQVPPHQSCGTMPKAGTAFINMPPEQLTLFIVSRTGMEQNRPLRRIL